MQINSFSFALTLILSSCISNIEADETYALVDPVVAGKPALVDQGYYATKPPIPEEDYMYPRPMEVDEIAEAELPYYVPDMHVDEAAKCPCFGFGDLGWAFEKALGMRADIHKKTSCDFEGTKINFNYVFLDDARSYVPDTPSYSTVINNVEYKHLSSLYDEEGGEYECGMEDMRMGEITEAQAKACHELLSDTCNILETRLCPCYGVEDLVTIESSIEQGALLVNLDQTSCDEYGIQMLDNRKVHYIEQEGIQETAVCVDGSNAEKLLSADQEFHCNRMLEDSCSALGIKGEPIITQYPGPIKYPEPEYPVLVEPVIIDPVVIDDHTCPCFNQQKGLQWINYEKTGSMVDVDRSTSCIPTDSTIKLNWVYLDEARSGDAGGVSIVGKDGVKYTELAAKYDPESNIYTCTREDISHTISAAQAQACYQDLEDACLYMEERVCPCYSVSDLVQIELSVSDGETDINMETTCVLKENYGLFSIGEDVFGSLHETKIATFDFSGNDGTMSCFNTATGEEDLNFDQQFHCHAMMEDSCLAVFRLEGEKLPLFTPTDQNPEQEEPDIKLPTTYDENMSGSNPAGQKPSGDQPVVTLADLGDIASDDPDFRRNGNEKRSCEWAAKKPGRRCNKVDKPTGYPVSHFCRMSCAPDFVTDLKDTDCSPQPMEDSEESSGLLDDLHFHEDGKRLRDCAWVSKNPCRRCSGEDSLTGRRAYEFCGMACRGIAVDPVNPNSATDSLIDNPHFHKDGRRWRNCKWVSEKPDRRCSKKDRLTGKPVSDYCLKTCTNLERSQE